MVRENKKKILYDAASNGDLATFQQQLQGDKFLLDDVSFAGRNLLHIAVIQGQKSIVEEVLRINAELARSLDSQQSSALHIAAAKGNLEITQVLLEKAPEVRWWRDCHGMNPIHIASVNGHIEILDKLVEWDISPAREKVDKGQTVLHLCIKYGKYDVLRHLVEKFDEEFVGTKDEDGETLLHLAARYNQIEMIQFLVEQNKISKMERNSAGDAAWDLVKNTASPTLKRLLRARRLYLPNQAIGKFGQGMLIAAGLIAGLAFNVSVNPPGGVWKEGSSHLVGRPVMATTNPTEYTILVISSCLAFFYSLFTIALVVTAITFEHTLLFNAGIWSTYASVLFIMISYVVSITLNSFSPGYALFVYDISLFHLALPLGILPMGPLVILMYFALKWYR